MTSLDLGLAAIRLLSGIQSRVVDLAVLLKISQRGAYRVVQDLQHLGLRVQREKVGKESWLWISAADARRWLAKLSGADGRKARQ